MAEGRMLKRKISVDHKVADLKDNTQRLLFTWAIAHLDIEGRIAGDPREFRALVCPLLELSFDEILDFFASAEHLGLIHRYEINGQWVINYPGFLKNQQLRRDREAKSCLPAPPLINDTPGVFPDNSRRTPIVPPEVKEVKEVKEKKASQASPATWNLSEDQKKELSRLCVTVTNKFPNRFNPYDWIQKNIAMNPRAHLHVMRRMTEGNGIKDPWPYADQIGQEENKNYNAQDSEKECNKNKEFLKDLIENLNRKEVKT